MHVGAETPSTVKTPIRLAAPLITNLVEEDGAGYYQRIIALALPRIDGQVRESFMPYKRALIEFEKQHFDCIYSFTSVLEEKLGKDVIISSYPLGAFAYYVFAPKHVVLPTTEQLKRSIVGAVLGHERYYRHVLDAEISLDFVHSDETNLKLLSLQRIDYMIAALPDIKPHVSQLNYNPDKPLVKNFDRITCYNNDKNAQFLQRLSTVLKELKRSGRYYELEPDLYLEFEVE